MKIAVFYEHILEASRQTGTAVADLLLQVRSAGITGVDCDVETIQSGGEDFKALLASAAMEVASVHGFFDLGEGEAAEANSLIDAAAETDVKTVLIIPGFVDGGDGAERDIKLNRIAEGLNRLCTYAGGKNVQVTLEDFDSVRAPFSTDEQLLWFMERVPALRCTFDTGNFIYSGIETLGAFERLKGKIVHVHLKDRALSPVPEENPVYTQGGMAMYSSPVGYGCIPIAKVLEKLRQIGYNGYLTIEHYGALNQLETMKKSAEWLNTQQGIK